MKLEEHVLKAIEAFDRYEKDHALMHATFAIEATARKLFPNKTLGKKSYKECVRSYWWIIERFIGEGINLEETKFKNLKLDNGNGNFILNPDLADVVYHVFRCHHAHAKEIPIKYKLLETKSGHYPWVIDRFNNGLCIPETLIWALLAVSVFSKVNTGIKTEGQHYLFWENKNIGIIKKFLIKDYWGKEDEIKNFFSDKPQIRIKFEGL